MVMGLILELVAEDATLRFMIVNERKWCDVILKQGGERYYLGADDADLIAKRFLRILDRQNFPEAELELNDERWTKVTCLLEAHTCTYGRLLPTGLRLQFQDFHNKMLTRVDLSNDDMQRWKAQIEQFASRP